MPTNINRVVLEGELTDDPTVEAGTCRLRLLVTTLRKDETGAWVGRPNLFDVVVDGHLAERCAASLRRGRQIGIEGSLAWQPGDIANPNARARVEVVADAVRPLDVRASLLIPTPKPEESSADEAATSDEATSSDEAATAA